MTLQTYLSQIEADERALKQDAKAISERDYEKLVAHHLHLIATLKETAAGARPPRRPAPEAPAKANT